MLRRWGRFVTGHETDGAAIRMLLVRHGETVWHRDNRYAGASSDIDLTERGIEQAGKLARWARTVGPAAVVTSPVRRAVETARPSADVLGLDLQQVDDLREVSFGVAEGRTIEELILTDASMVQRFRADPVAHPFPGSESPTDAAHRASGAIRAIAGTTTARCVLVVGHNTVLRLALCDLLGVPISRYRTFLPKLDNGAVTAIGVPTDPDRYASLLSLNVHPRPDP